MNHTDIESIFYKHGIEFSGHISKVPVGFTNEVYDIDNRYILKICSDKNNEPFFRREALLYEFFEDKLPVPKLEIFDDSRTDRSRIYMIYPKIVGDNLYNVWHTYSTEQRRSVIKQLCKMLKVLNDTEVRELPNNTGITTSSNWKDKVITKINKYLAIVKEANTLTPDEIEAVKSFTADNQDALDEQVMGLVYWDAHFDNVIVDEGEIVGLLDFERTDYESIDHVLDLVGSMQRYPKKYASEYAEQFIKPEDYQDLMGWYREFYPEVFEFGSLETRLDFYDLAHCLEDLENWPNVEQLKNDVRRVVGL